MGAALSDTDTDTDCDYDDEDEDEHEDEDETRGSLFATESLAPSPFADALFILCCPTFRFS